MSVPMPTRARQGVSAAAEAARAARFSTGQAPGWRRDAISPVVAAGFVVAYLVVAELGGQLSTAGDISPWYPPAGLSLAAVLIFGARAVPLVFVADALQLLVRGQAGGLDAVVLGLAQALFWGGAGLLLRPRLLAEAPLSRMRDLAWFAALGVALGPLVAGVVGVALLVLLGTGDWQAYGSTVRVYVVGDAIGVLSLAPTLIVLSGWGRRPAAAWGAVRGAVGGHGWEGWAMIVATALVPVATVSLWEGGLLALAPLPIAWVALRRGMPTAALALTVWSTAAVAAFAAGGDGTRLREISALMVSTGLLALAAGAVVTERERGRARLAYLALHDDLTGLPNRLGLTERVEDALGRSGRGDVAVLHVRLELSASSEVLAPETIDRVLLRGAHRLRRLTSPDATIARIGTGRFVVLVDGPDARRVDAIAARLVAGLSTPAVVDGREYLLGPVVGTALGSSSADPAGMLDHAARAAEIAGPRTRHIAAYDAGMAAAAEEARAVGEALRQALDEGGLHLHYQPIVAMDDGRALGAEALLRWTHVDRGAIGPNEFIPVAEACGLILPLGRWVLREACRSAAAWPTAPEAAAAGPARRSGDRASSGLMVHVNVSPVQMRDEGLTDFVAATLQQTGLPASRLCLELTESALFDDLDVAATRILELTALGVSVVLDDFGTGASSLSWLQRLPVSALKIDRSFVSGLQDGAVDLAIVTATLGLAEAISLDTVAEGVETQAQLTALRGLGCTSVQGFLISRPISEDALHKWLATPTLPAAQPRPAPPDTPLHQLAD